MKVVTVRKDHQCSSIDDKGFLCNLPINKGDRAKVVNTKYGRVSGSGSYWITEYFHLNCRVRREYE